MPSRAEDGRSRTDGGPNRAGRQTGPHGRAGEGFAALEWFLAQEGSKRCCGGSGGGGGGAAAASSETTGDVALHLCGTAGRHYQRLGWARQGAARHSLALQKKGESTG